MVGLYHPEQEAAHTLSTSLYSRHMKSSYTEEGWGKEKREERRKMGGREMAEEE